MALPDDCALCALGALAATAVNITTILTLLSFLEVEAHPLDETSENVSCPSHPPHQVQWIEVHCDVHIDLMLVALCGGVTKGVVMTIHCADTSSPSFISWVEPTACPFNDSDEFCTSLILCFGQGVFAFLTTTFDSFLGVAMVRNQF